MPRARVGVIGAVLTVTAGWLLPLPASAAVDSHVYTWGSNSFGQLGDGSAPSATRGAPGLASISDVIDVSGGREHVIALTDSGTVYAWGSDAFGQLGDGAALQNHSSPVVVAGLTNVTNVDDGHYHSLALESDGTVWGWGQNSLGQLAQGDAVARVPTPRQWGDVTDAVGVYGGRDMTYVLSADGTVWCSGGFGLECGRADGGSKITSPVAVGGLPDVVEIAGGRNHAVALASDGTVWTWGENTYGQLGDGSTTDRRTPVQVEGLSDIVDVGAGAEHSLAVDSAGHVFTWGRNYRGELGLGDTVNRHQATQVPGLSGIVEVDAGRSHSFAIGADGQLWAWGWNEGQQVNSSASDSVRAPYLVPGVSDVVAAGGGQAYSVALTQSADPLLVDGFDDGLSDWTVSGALAIDETRSSPVGEAPSVRAAVTKRRAGAVRALPQPVATACARIWARPESIGTMTTLLALRDGAGDPIVSLRVAKSGALNARSGPSATSARVGARLDVGTWEQVELCSRHEQGSADQVSVSVGGSPIRSWAWPTSTVAEVQIGSTRKVTATVNLDDVAVF